MYGHINLRDSSAACFHFNTTVLKLLFRSLRRYFDGKISSNINNTLASEVLSQYKVYVFFFYYCE